jgi:hypothetical protein
VRRRVGEEAHIGHVVHLMELSPGDAFGASAQLSDLARASTTSRFTLLRGCAVSRG